MADTILMDPLDDLLNQLEGVEEEELEALQPEEPKKAELRAIDIFAESTHTKSKENQNSVKNSEFQNENSDDEELYVKKKELSEQGAHLENYLKKNASTSGPKATDAWKSNKKSHLTGLTKPDSEAVCLGIVRFDKFQITTRNPKISASSFGAFTAGMKLEKLSSLKPSSSFKEAWCTMGVIVEKGFKKKSANGNDFLIWKLHDLKDCQTPPIKLLMFGDAIKDHWEIKLGQAIALVSAQIADDSNAAGKKATAVTLKVSKSTNIVEIGQSAHYGTCKGTRQQDGQRCSNFVNSSLSEYCVFHVMSAARKLSAKRGVFNALTCGPNVGGLNLPKKHTATPRPPVMNRPGLPGIGLSNSTGSPLLRDTMRPADSNHLTTPTSSLKATTKEEQKATLNDLLAQNKNTFAARQMLKLKEKKDEKGEVMEEMIEFMANRDAEKHESFGAFLKADTEREKMEKAQSSVDLRISSSSSSSSSAPSIATSSTPSRLWNMSMSTKKHQPMGHKDAQEHAARLRAIAILKAKKAGKEGGVKRKATEETVPDAKRQKSEAGVSSKMEEIKKMLARKSSHHQEAEKAEHDAIQRHLTGMEEREKVETFTTTCVEVKDVKVVTCKQCKYTAQFANSECFKNEHTLVKHTADKRFFRCTGCKKRVVCFEMMPVKPCNHCNENKWVRVAMKDERKVVLDSEKLELRGEERTFVNS